MQFLGVFFGYVIANNVLEKVTGGNTAEYSSAFQENWKLRQQEWDMEARRRHEDIRNGTYRHARAV